MKFFALAWLLALSPLPAEIPALYREALKNLGAEEFSAREAAFALLKTAPATERELAEELERVSLEEGGETAARARVLSYRMTFGLAPDAPKAVRDALETWESGLAESPGDERPADIAALRKADPQSLINYRAVYRRAFAGLQGRPLAGLLKEALPVFLPENRREDGAANLRFLFEEVGGLEGEDFTGFVAEAAAVVFAKDRKPVREEVEVFSEMVALAGEEVFTALVEKVDNPAIFPLIVTRLPLAERTASYTDWGDLLNQSNLGPDSLEARFLLASLLQEPEEIRRAVVANGLHAVLKHVSLLDGFPPGVAAEVAKRFADDPGLSGENGPIPPRLARAMLMWGDEQLAPVILERAMTAEDGLSIHAFVMTALLKEELPQRIADYRDRFDKDPSALNRRVLAHLLNAAERRDEAFALLTEEDHDFFAYRALALLLGNWDAVADLHRARLEGLSDDKRGRKTKEWFREMTGLAFCLRLAGKEAEFRAAAEELTKSMVSNLESGGYREPQLLLNLGEPALARKVSEAWENYGEVFEILILEHRYREAADYAMACAVDPEKFEAAREAQKYFETRAPKLAAEIRAVLPPAEAEKPDNPENAPAEVTPQQITEAASRLSTWESLDYPDKGLLLKAATEPEQGELRRKLIALWKVWGKREEDIYGLRPLLETEEEWEFLAGLDFESWNQRRSDGHSLTSSGRYLLKGGKTEEGNRRVHLGPLMPMEADGGHYRIWGVAADQRKPTGKTPSEVAALMSYGKGLFSCNIAWRDSFHPLRKLGQPRRGALNWAAAHYSFCTEQAGSYGENFWALNNSMHIEEGLGLDALENGRAEEAERRLTESWRLSIEPVWLGAALVSHYRSTGREADARRIYDGFRERLEGYAKDLPGEELFPKKLAEWAEALHQEIP